MEISRANALFKKRFRHLIQRLHAPALSGLRVRFP
jgi:hypothetical protein